MVKMMSLVWFIPLFPLLGFLINGLLFKRINPKLSGWIASIMIFMSFVFSVIIYLEEKTQELPNTIFIFNWFKVGDLNFPFEFLVDHLSILMLLVVTGVGFLIHIYSIGYMKGDEGIARFFSYMNLFVFSMLLLVLGGNYLVMFIGWEGVGLCSYLLIGFWFKNNDFNNAAKKAFIMNRIGDLGFLIGIFLILTTFGTLNYLEVFKQASAFQIGTPIIFSITILLFIGAIGKSAQIPLFTWLPDAMAGPTPVSALIHAATMVTAGIYMVVRSNLLFMLAPQTMTIIAVVGLSTMLLAASIAIFQNDIKKILAYSTVSQLGLMFLALGVGAFSGAVFHLTTHAFFKALLFLAAGNIIHALHGEQDIRKMGGLKNKIPITFILFLCGVLAISGIPPFSGFFSKDEILLSAFLNSTVFGVLALMASMLTVFYMFRLFFLVFYGQFRGNPDQLNQAHEGPKVMIYPLLVLAILAAVAGFFGLPHVFGYHLLNGFLGSVIPQLGHAEINSNFEITLMLSAFLGALAIIVIGYFIYIRNKKVPASDTSKRNIFISIIYHKYYFDEIYQMIIINPILYLSRIFHSIIELKIIDGFVEKIGKLVLLSSNILKFQQTGNVGFYLFAMVVGIIAVLFLNIFTNFL